MFTGIIQDTGKIKTKTPKGDSIVFSIDPLSQDFLKDIKAGDSIAINGACMTVEKHSGTDFEFTSIKESLAKTNLSHLQIDSIVNLEKAMALNSKLDGHIVQGHVDTTGEIEKIKLKNNSREFYIRMPYKFKNNIIYVGSIAINGVSLTIAEIVKEKSKNILIKVAIIPHTFEVTNFKQLKKSDIVNIEFDMIGKYVQRLLKKK